MTNGATSDEIMRPTTYSDAKSEVLFWLKEHGLERLMERLVENGYDDLEAVSRCNEIELDEFLESCGSGENHEELRKLILDLGELGIREFRIRMRNKKNNPSPFQEYVLDRHALEFIEKEGYLSLNFPMTNKETWVDKFCILKDGKFSWKPSKKAPYFESELNLNRDGCKLESQDAQIALYPPNSQHASLIIDFDIVASIQEWLPSLDSEPSRSSRAHTLICHDSSSSYHYKSGTDQQIDTDVSLLFSASQNELVNIADAAKSQKYMTMLLAGSVFKKYKKNKTAQRLIYCNRDLSKLVWAQPKNRRTIQGFLNTQDIFEIETGYGTGKNKLKLFVVSKNRILELEAKDSRMLHEWVQGLKYMLEALKIRTEQERAKKKSPEFKAVTEHRLKECREQLMMGDVFKISKLSGTQTKQFFCTDDMLELQWKDIERFKIRGSIPLTEIVEVFSEKSKNDNKFCIAAKKQLLSLEASNNEHKEKFIEALQFWMKNAN